MLTRAKYLATAGRRTLPGTVGSCLRVWQMKCRRSLSACWSRLPRHPKTVNLKLVPCTTNEKRIIRNLACHRNEEGSPFQWNKRVSPDLPEALQSCHTVNQEGYISYLSTCACQSMKVQMCLRKRECAHVIVHASVFMQQACAQERVDYSFIWLTDNTCAVLWPTIFTYIDDGISLNVVHVRVAQAQLLASSLGGAHNSRGDCVLEGKWAADGDHKFPWPQVWWVAQQQYRKLSLDKGRQSRGKLRWNRSTRSVGIITVQIWQKNNNNNALILKLSSKLFFKIWKFI